MSDEAIAAATGAHPATVQRVLADLKWVYGANNRVGLALALQREAICLATSNGGIYEAG